MAAPSDLSLRRDRRSRSRAPPPASSPTRSSSPARLLPLLLLFASASSRVAAAFDCSSLDCNGRGTCEPGPPSLPGQRAADLPWAANETSESSSWDVHCDCDPGWTGLRCERGFVGCGDDGDGNAVGEAEEDFDHLCYHGGTCLEGSVVNGKMRYHCDCTDAVDPVTGTKYAGKYCEHAETERCTGSEEFCVNGGKCKKDAARKAYPCKCDGTNHEGPHCEYKLGEAPDCSSFDCNDRGICRPGVQSYDDAVEFFEMTAPERISKRHDDFRHCVCNDPLRYRGVHCDVEYQVCDDQVTCLNGGACTRKPGGTDHHCDCKSAATETESYAGRYCEHVSTGFCTRGEDHNGNSFCVNGGECGENSHDDCVCPDGYAGPLCEFAVGEPELPEELKCDLECSNNGRCRFGSKDFGPAEHFDALDVLTKTAQVDLMHCVCPEGYSGVTCDVRTELCGEDGDHVCLNGSECSEEGEEVPCDCDPAGDAYSSYAGLHCEFESTSFCGMDATSFCVNGGKCKAGGGVGHPGCECENGFEGDRCEYKPGTAPKPEVVAKQDPPTPEEPEESSEGGKPHTAFALAITFSCIATVVGLVLLVVTRQSMKFANAEREARMEATTGVQVAGANGFDPAGVGFGTPGKEEDDDEGDGGRGTKPTEMELL